MASITIRNLDDEMKTRLRMRACEHQRPMEEEVCVILCEVIGGRRNSRNLASIVCSHFRPAKDVDLDLPTIEPMCESPNFA